jgi:amino acid transporter
MSSPSPHVTADEWPRQEGVRPLLDATFGFFVWAAHLLTVYVAAALACGLGLVGRGPGTTALTTALVIATILAAAAVVVHSVRRWRQQRERPELRFRMSITVGCDAVAAVAIVWQILAILLVPPCA